MTYAWLSDGTPVSATLGEGNLPGRLYNGSFVFVTDSTRIDIAESVAWDEGRIFFLDTDTTDCWYAGDHLGNVRSVIDISRGQAVPQVLEQSDYLPYGTRINNTAFASMSGENRWRYAAKEEQRLNCLVTDPSAPNDEYNRSLNLGLLNFGARMYDPFTARWTDVDPMAKAFPCVCPLSYCGGDPINHLDPDGNWVWVAVGVAIEYGSQVYNNLQNGKTGYDAWVGDVNFVRVGLSAINPGKKLFLAKTIVVEGAKAAVSYTPNDGLSINNNVEDVAKETIKNTAINATVGNVLDAASPQAVETTAKEASNAAKKVSSASHKASRNPASPQAATALSEAEGKASSSGAQAAGTRALNNTIGANPEATKAAINIVNKALENETDRQRKY